MDLEGWASVVASIWFLGGLIIFSIGICGIYLAKIYQQVKNRPFTIVRETYGGQLRAAALPADGAEPIALQPDQSAKSTPYVDSTQAAEASAQAMRTGIRELQ
jgi:hypothetical protein